MKPLGVLLAAIIWPTIQYCCITEVHQAQHKTEIKIIAEKIFGKHPNVDPNLHLVYDQTF